jgi:hypothetical protein
MLTFLEALAESVLSDVISTFVGAFLALHAHHHLVKRRERRRDGEERPPAGEER